MKRAATVTKSSAGDSRYMSPQLREACMRGTQYNPFKADVFALGAALLHMVTLASPEALLTAERLDEAVGRQVARINCSTELQALLRTMLAYQEGARPTMQQVCSALTSVSSVSREFSPPILQAGKASVCISELSPEDVNRLMKESWPDTFNISPNDGIQRQFSTYSIDQLQITNVHKLPISSANLKRFQQTVGSLSSQTCMWLWHGTSSALCRNASCKRRNCSLCGVVQSGFDVERARTTTTSFQMFGKAAYFSRSDQLP